MSLTPHNFPFKRIAVPVIALFECSLSPSPALAEDNASVREPVKLGVIVPLTGPMAFFGKDLVRAYDLAVEDQPDIKRLLKVIWEDSAYDSKKAVAVFNKLTSVDQVDVLYSFGGPMLNALAPLAEKQKIPFFATESQKSDCEGKEFCSLFRNEEDEWGVATWQVLRKAGYKKIGIVKNQNQFMNTFVDAIIRTKRPDEQVNIFIDVPPDTVDLRSETISLRSKRVDALGVFLLPNSHKGFLNALQALNMRMPMFGVEEFLDRDLNQGFDDTIAGTPRL